MFILLVFEYLSKTSQKLTWDKIKTRISQYFVKGPSCKGFLSCCNFISTTHLATSKKPSIRLPNASHRHLSFIFVQLLTVRNSASNLKTLKLKNCHSVCSTHNLRSLLLLRHKQGKKWNYTKTQTCEQKCELKPHLIPTSELIIFSLNQTFMQNFLR